MAVIGLSSGNTDDNWWTNILQLVFFDIADWSQLPVDSHIMRYQRLVSHVATQSTRNSHVQQSDCRKSAILSRGTSRLSVTEYLSEMRLDNAMNDHRRC